MKKIVFLGLAVVMILALLSTGCTESDDNGGEEEEEREPASTFSLLDLENNTVKLSSFINDDIVVILDFMFMDCDPCIKEMEELDDIHSNYDESEVQIISIDIVDSELERSRLASHIENNSYEWIFVVDTEAKDVKGDYQVTSYPTLVIIDKEGKIAYRHEEKTYYSTLSSELDKLLEE